MELILESYECGDIDIDDANTYIEFVEYADLEDIGDIDVLTEMVDLLIDDGDMYYENGNKPKLTPEQAARRKAEKKAKRMKVLKTGGKVLALGGLAAGAGLAGYKASDKKNHEKIQELDKKLQVTKDAFKQANAAKRSERDARNLLGAFNDDIYDSLLWRNQELEKRNFDLKSAFRQANSRKREVKSALKKANDSKLD